MKQSRRYKHTIADNDYADTKQIVRNVFMLIHTV